MKKFLVLLFAMCWAIPIYIWSQAKKTPEEIQAYFQKRDSTLLELELQRQQLEKDLGQLLRSGAYDTAQTKAAQYRKAGLLSYQSHEKINATLAYLKGNKERAYQYVLKDADYRLRLNGGGGDPYDFIVDYNLCLPLVQDTLLAHMVHTKVNDFYRSLPYPDPGTGLALSHMYYQWQKNWNRSDSCMSDSCRTACQPVIREQSESIVEKLLRLLDEHGGFYTLHEIGPAYNYQFSIIRELQEPDLRRKLLPYYFNSMQQGNFSKHAYVTMLLEQELWENPGSAGYQEARRDSLCSVFGCRHYVDSATQHVIIRE
jgi:hypothetical protein